MSKLFRRCCKNCMKRMIVIAVAALLLTGCAEGGDTARELRKDMRMCAVVHTVGDKEYTAELERTESAGWSVTLTEPESVRGLKIDYLADGTCTVELEGHRDVYKRGELPESGPFDLLTAAADMCIEGKGVSGRSSGNDTEYKGRLRGTAFTVKSSGGIISEISFDGGPSAELTDCPAVALTGSGSSEPQV